MTSVQRRSDDLKRLTLREFVMRNEDGAPIPPNSVITIGDLLGNTVWTRDVNLDSVTTNNLTAIGITATGITTQTITGTTGTITSFHSDAIYTNTLAMDSFVIGAIQAGRIESDVATITSINAGNVTASTLEATTGTFDTINATTIYSGTVGFQTITALDISCSTLNVGTTANVTSINAGNVTTNTIGATAGIIQNVTSDIITLETMVFTNGSTSYIERVNGSMFQIGAAGATIPNISMTSDQTSISNGIIITDLAVTMNVPLVVNQLNYFSYSPPDYHIPVDCYPEYPGYYPIVNRLPETDISVNIRTSNCSPGRYVMFTSTPEAFANIIFYIFSPSGTQLISGIQKMNGGGYSFDIIRANNVLYICNLVDINATA